MSFNMEPGERDRGGRGGEGDRGGRGGEGEERRGEGRLV